MTAIYNFVTNVSSYFKRKYFSKSKSRYTIETTNIPVSDKKFVVAPKLDKVSLERRTRLTKFYTLEQEIEIFKNDFPDKYDYFLGKIEDIRKRYNIALGKIEEKLTVEVNPELNGEMLLEICDLEVEIERFINTEVKYIILSKKIQKLITKLNILYNVSISHPSEKDKVISQVLRALNVELEIAQEFKQCIYVLKNAQLKERMVTLLSYADYLSFKIILRNSDNMPEEAFSNLILYAEFKDFDYIPTFKAFIEDELSDLGELLIFINDEKYRNYFEQKLSALFNEIAYAPDLKALLLDREIWMKIFEAEANLLEFIKGCGVAEKEIVKVKLIDRMNIEVKESEVLTTPKTNANLAFITVFTETQDDKIWFLIKLFKQISDGITYKEIYFLLLLFDAISVIQNTENLLKRHIEKYIKQYSYNSKTINDKKQLLLDEMTATRYMKLFPIDEDVDKVSSVLQNLKIDFSVEDDGVYINTFYFNGLENIFFGETTNMVMTMENTTI